ncbi:MAG TPA: alpha/beta fold hydrolase [Terriglobales bacterium]|nr:alpha/beta fold hydrolase [Terriglobales bacterium]
MIAAGQRLGSFEHAGRRVAYATLGTGPPLVCDLSRLHHLDVFWRYPPYRRLVEALAREFTVVRVDRPGCGLSDRAAADFSMEAEVRLFDHLLDHLEVGETAVLGASSSALSTIALAALRPERVSRIALFGAWVGPAVDDTGYGEALDTLLRTQFTIATEVLAQSAAAGCTPAAARWLAAAFRESAAGAVVAEWLREAIRFDAGPLLGRVRCPALVLHRRDGPQTRAVRSRDVAAGLRDGVLLPLDGTASLIWEGDQEPLLAALLRFLAPSATLVPQTASVDAAELTAREREVAGLVAQGLTNADIGARLGIGRRTVESHLERVRSRLGLLSRADLAAWAARAGLIDTLDL